MLIFLLLTFADAVADANADAGCSTIALPERCSGELKKEGVILYGLGKLNYSELRFNQRKVVEGYASGKDVFSYSPTGSGKSLTFELACLCDKFYSLMKPIAFGRCKISTR